MFLVREAKNSVEVIVIDSGFFNRCCFEDAAVAFPRKNYLTRMRSEIKRQLERKRDVGYLLMASSKAAHIVEN
jgi:hypothetical protein